MPPKYGAVLIKPPPMTVPMTNTTDPTRALLCFTRNDASST